MTDTYSPDDFGQKEVDFHRKFTLRLDDSRNYFLNCIKPRLDRSYKLYMAYNGDRAREIKKWQANIFVPYVQAVVETLMPRILDARPEFTVQGRTEDDQPRAERLQQLADYTWEMSNMDQTSEDVTRAALIYGTGYMQVSWKKDVRKHKFLSSKDLLDKKLKWVEREETFYDAPYCEWVDNYSLLYDWHNVPRASKQYWFKRLILTGTEIRRRYPMADPKRLKLAFARNDNDLNDYGSIKNDIKLTHESILKGSDHNQLSAGISQEKYTEQGHDDTDNRFYEVFEGTYPMEDQYFVTVSKVPIIKGCYIPLPYDFKETPFIEVPYLRSPGEFEGVGLPLLLENPQLMLNMIKNQRLDAATLNIHKMWVVSPLAGIDKKELVTRPFGIIYSPDPQGVREVQFSDVKASAYREEELIKSDMRYASGVDDFSMGAGGGAASATEVRHLRESTLERVRLFVNHLGGAYGTVLRYWISMYRQFFTRKMTIRIIGEDGMEHFPIIARDDIKGQFDFRASVLPSIAGKNDIDKKQGMDLFQLLINMPFVDPRRLTSKVLQSWNWSLDSVAKKEEEAPPGMGMQPGAEGMGMQPGMEGAMPGMSAGPPGAGSGAPPTSGGGVIPESVIRQAVGLLGGKPAAGDNPVGEMANPVNLLKSGGLPPTVKGVKKTAGQKTTNSRGANRGGKVNTNLPVNKSYGASDSDNLANKAANIQK